MEEATKETVEVFKKHCPFHPELKDCKGCSDAYKCILYRKEE